MIFKHREFDNEGAHKVRTRDSYWLLGPFCI